MCAKGRGSAVPLCANAPVSPHLWRRMPALSDRPEQLNGSLLFTQNSKFLNAEAVRSDKFLEKENIIIVLL